jgi:hypothetical protein
VQGPLPQPGVPGSCDPRTWDRAGLRNVACVIDLTDTEQANVRAAIRFLATRAGGWKVIAAALGFSKHTLVHVKKGEKNVSPWMALCGADGRGWRRRRDR